MFTRITITRICQIVQVNLSTIKAAHVVTSIKQSPVLRGNIFRVLS
jgi:hypothetical protein